MEKAIFEGENLAALFSAISKAQAQCEKVIKDAESGAFKGSKYATLDNVINAVMPAFNAQDLAIIQPPLSGNGEIAVETIVTHKDGGIMRSILVMKPTKSDPQGFGSAITYARRYALMAIAGVAPEDDDGDAASGSTKAANETNKATQSKQQPTSPVQQFASTAEFNKSGLNEQWTAEIDACKTIKMLLDWWHENGASVLSSPAKTGIQDGIIATAKSLIGEFDDVDMLREDLKFNSQSLSRTPFNEDIRAAYTQKGQSLNSQTEKAA